MRRRELRRIRRLTAAAHSARETSPRWSRGVSLAFTEGIRDAGYGDIGTPRLLEFRIHGVSPEFVDQMANLGFGDVGPARWVEFRIHGTRMD